MAIASYGLTTRQRLKDFLDISADDATTNNVLDRIINAVTDWAESYCQRRFSWTAYTNEMYDGNDSQILMLRNYPVQTGETFTLAQRTSALDEDEWETIDSEYYFITPEFGYVEYPKARYGNKGREFIVGNQKVSATFHRQSANHSLVGTFDDFNERPFIAAPSVNPLDSDDGSVPMEQRAHF